MSLPAGTRVPLFFAPTPSNPQFEFLAAGGRYVLLVFLPGPSSERDACLSALAARRELFRDDNACAFAVLPDPESFARAVDGANGLRWFNDGQGEVRRLYGAVQSSGAVRPEWFLIDPSERLVACGPLEQIEAALDALAGLGDVEAYAGVALTAPVLIVPRVLEPEFCRELIAAYEAQGGQPSGIMATIDGKLTPVLDGRKRRRDAEIPPGPLVDGLRARLAARLVPEIKRAFQFDATRIERFIVACYDAEDGGYFRMHKDDGDPGTAHRKFAVTLNLNDDFEGGELRFAEYGRRTYRAPAGGAVVFSCTLLHEATPVTRGRRYATLPFLYDEAGARLRQANAAAAEQAKSQPAAE